jgi:hypothetical protein
VKAVAATRNNIGQQVNDWLGRALQPELPLEG